MTSAAYRENFALIEWRPVRSRPARVQAPAARSDFPAPLLIRDEMQPVKSMASGKIYDSKSAIRAEYRRLCVVEIGNDPARLKPRVKPKPDRKAIHDTLQRAEARFNRGERV